MKNLRQPISKGFKRNILTAMLIRMNSPAKPAMRGSISLGSSEITDDMFVPAAIAASEADEAETLPPEVLPDLAVKPYIERVRTSDTATHFK